ncbi:leucine-rich repeat domain-containing protein [Rapidithrix thailandica]|uniref:Leucine-rich repeat domain-containing protein n=1 Tax=Rapidithrix thailandica TaxID=413964 RepID=A0AAW9S4Y1_9BACT
MKNLLILSFCFTIVKLHAQANYQYIDENTIQLILSAKKIDNTRIINEVLKKPKSEKLKNLSIAGNISKLPQEIYALNWVEVIEITVDNPLELDRDFSKFESLKNLAVFSGLSSIDEDIILLNIQSVWFPNSGLSAFPKAICSWENLEYIDIQNGNFETIPKEISNLEHLKHLNLSNNGIEKLPEEIGGLKSLQSLGLGSNPLQTLPMSICKLVSLSELYLTLTPKLILSKDLENCLKCEIFK